MTLEEARGRMSLRELHVWEQVYLREAAREAYTAKHRAVVEQGQAEQAQINGR